MITVREAKHLVQYHQPAPRITQKSLVEISGCILAKDVAADSPSPRFTNSAMDGFAIAFIEKATTFRIIGESAAGKPLNIHLHMGEAAKISTGAVLPPGTDTVLPVEDVVCEGDIVHLKKPARQGQWVRKEGAEYARGDLVLRSGTLLRPAHIALAAQLGLTELPVYEAPVVALLATGSEIVSIGKGDVALLEGQIFDANTPMLQAAVQDFGAKVLPPRRVEDTLESTLSALHNVMQQADIICTTGGVSVGDHDFVKQAAAELGFTTIFWRVRQKPGKPLFFATRGSTLLFGLPGNPVSTLMCFIHYVRPIIASMLGRDTAWQTIQGRMSQSLVNRGGRAEFVRVRLEKATEHNNVVLDDNILPVVVPLEKQESFMLTSLTEADGFVFLDIDEEIYAGAPIEVMLW